MLKVAKLERQLVQSSKQYPSDFHRKNISTPAFMAFMSKSFVCLVDQHAVFDDVRLNVGNYYNRYHGVFQAPVSGTYHFALTLSIDNQSGHDFYAFLVAGDGNKILGYVFQTTTKEIWQSKTVSVLAYLESGEDVWIKCTIHDSEIAGGLHSCFSGFLVDSQYIPL
ncbi:hypothetical protein CHS0354_004102 [Potamilus streckersoni]|nr:hypothetical protein CHS0354_004102 [Potamilus streckersoni]